MSVTAVPAGPPDAHAEAPDFGWKDNRRMEGWLGDFRRKYIWKRYPSLRRWVAFAGAVGLVATAAALVRHYTDDGVATVKLNPLHCVWTDTIPSATLKAIEDQIKEKVIQICPIKQVWFWRKVFFVGQSWKIHSTSDVPVSEKVEVKPDE